jgi:non-specific protein-tyrosine kinase
LWALPRTRAARRQREITFFDSSSPQGEAFRHLRTHISALNNGASSQALLVTSTRPGEGKSTVVVNLARAMAQAGRRVLVVDYDLRQPVMHTVFGLSNDIGLTNLLKHEAAPESAIQDSSVGGIKVLTSGPASPESVELLSSCQIAAMLRQFAGQFDLVLVDAPPYLTVADAAVLAPGADGVILVVEQAHVRKDEVRAACHLLAEVKAKVIGLVVNRARQNGSYGYPKPRLG